MPAYRRAGFDVRAVYDTDAAAARALAERFGIGRVCGSLDELLDLPEVAVVDVAVPAEHNPAIASRAFEAGKHVLLQKPMASDSTRARAIVGAAARAGRLVAVNHQMRWAPSVRAAAELLRQGAFGEVIDYSMRFNRRTDWSAWPWLADLSFPELWYNSIHYLDAARSWFGTPATVYARLGSHPASGLDGPSRAVIVAGHPGGVTGVVQAGHDSPKSPLSWTAEFAVEGTDLMAEGVIGDMIGRPGQVPDSIRLHYRSGASSVERELEGSWFPDAFTGPMRSLMAAIADGGEPETSGADAVETLLLLEAVEASHRLGAVVEVAASSPTAGQISRAPRP